MQNTASQPPIRLFGIFPYDRSAKPRWLLTEMGLKWEDQWINREKQEYESPAYLKVNPMGRVPAMIHGDTPIFESSAICAFLADQYLEKGLAPKLGTPERAEYQKWMFFAAATLDPFMSRIMIIEDIPAGELRTTKESALMGDYEDAVNVLNQALTRGPFLLGQQFTAADICVGYHIYWSTLWPEFDSILKKYPNVVNYIQRLKDKSSAIEAKVFSYSG